MNPYTFHIAPYDLASLGTLFMGMTVALLLAFAKRPDRAANLFLSSAVVVIVLKTGALTALALPALGPLLYFYVRQLTCTNQRFCWKDLLHFCPLLVSYWLPEWLVMIWVIGYLYLSHRLIQDFYSRLRPALMDRPRFAFRRLNHSLFLLGLLCVLSIFNAAFLLAVALILIGVAAEVILKLDANVQLAMPITYRSDAREKARRLKEVVAANRLYEDAELTLATLALKLAIHPHDLSRLINTGLDKNFSDFINEFRVREVSRKMRDPAYDRLTLPGIAYESGFNSQRTFNRVFKELTGETPVEYKNSLKKGLPIHKLATLSRTGPVILRPETFKRNIMFKNYLKIAYRQLLRQKLYASIKIGGFALGIAACLLIGLYIYNQTTYDGFYPGADRIFRVVGDGKASSGLAWPAPMSKAIQQDFPEVEFAGRIRPMNSYLGHAELRRADQEQNAYEEGIIYVDQSFVDAFKLPMVYGNGSTALNEPQTMVISKTMADKYYPGKNPVGQMMYLDNDKAHPYRIGAVMADIPANSHLHPFKFLITLSGMSFGDNEQNSWSWYNYVQYVKLKPGTNVAAFEQKLNTDLRKNYWTAEYRKGAQKTPKQQPKISMYTCSLCRILICIRANFPTG